MPTEEVKYSNGWIMILLLGVIFLGHLIKILVDLIQQARENCKKKAFEKKRKAALDKAEAAAAKAKEMKLKAEKAKKAIEEAEKKKRSEMFWTRMYH